MISIGGIPVVPEAFPDGTQKIDFHKGRHIVCLKKSDP